MWQALLTLRKGCNDLFASCWSGFLHKSFTNWNVVWITLILITSFTCTACIFPTESEARALAKERQKKDNHNLSKFGSLLFTPILIMIIVVLKCWNVSILNLNKPLRLILVHYVMPIDQIPLILLKCVLKSTLQFLNRFPKKWNGLGGLIPSNDLFIWTSWKYALRRGVNQ